LVVATLIFGIIGVVLTSIVGPLLQAVSPATFTAVENGEEIVETVTRNITGGGMAVLGLAWLVLLVVGGVIAAAWYSGLLAIADGQPVSVGSFFKPRNVVAVILASLIIGLVSTVASLIVMLVPYLGGLLSAAVSALVALFTFFTTVAIVDRNLSPVDGIRASLDVVKKHFGPVVLAWIVSTAVLFVGALLCGFGLLVAAPVAYLFKVFTWRRLTGATVAPPIG
jgi:uncharacterized membrane protein